MKTMGIVAGILALWVLFVVGFQRIIVDPPYGNDPVVVRVR